MKTIAPGKINYPDGGADHRKKLARMAKNQKKRRAFWKKYKETHLKK